MPDSMQMQQVVSKLRPLALIGGAGVWLGGLAVGPFVDWAFGTWMLVVGTTLMLASDIGRPVLINVFSQVEEVGQASPTDDRSDHGYV
jgi:hypothetical protein